jgi:drug/metabolite transporter (DMT)-like permease
MTMIAFAANPLLCRFALKNEEIDPVSFTSIRLISGAVALGLLLIIRNGSSIMAGNCLSALALFTYAAAFSFSYVTLQVGTGALLLFSSVQATMVGYGLYSGERLGTKQTVGFIVALGGLIWLFLPGLSAPPLWGSVLMITAGVAWGIYSLRGRKKGDPLSVTMGNFVYAIVPTVVLSGLYVHSSNCSRAGILYAVISGALSSGCGYCIWYMALKELKLTAASVVQLSVPVLAALSGIMILGEPITIRLFVASVAILGGIAIVVIEK